MKKFLVVLVAISLFPNVAFAFNVEQAVEDVCACREEYLKQTEKKMELMNKVQASGDMSQIEAMKSEGIAAADAATRCFEKLGKKYPEMDKSEKLRDEVMAKADKKCPNPGKMK